MNKKLFLLLLVIVAVLLISGCVERNKQKPTIPAPTPSPTSPFTLGPGNYDFSLIHQGLARNYKVHVPSSYKKVNSISLVIAIHGGGGKAEGMQRMTLLDATAGRESFIVVYPEGTGKVTLGKLYGSWNTGKCCPPASDNNVDDVGFISKMIDKLAIDFNIDKKRIYATGHSNGGLMSYKLACDLSDKIAAIAPIGPPIVIDPCQPQKAVSIIHFHGTNDLCALYRGGFPENCAQKFLKKIGIPVKKDTLRDGGSVPDYIRQWKDINGCADSAVRTFKNGNAACITYGSCRDGAEVTLCTIEGMGHTWPGGTYGVKACDNNPNGYVCKAWKDTIGSLSSDINANDVMWEFFKKHPIK